MRLFVTSSPSPSTIVHSPFVVCLLAPRFMQACTRDPTHSRFAISLCGDLWGSVWGNLRVFCLRGERRGFCLRGKRRVFLFPWREMSRMKSPRDMSRDEMKAELISMSQEMSHGTDLDSWTGSRVLIGVFFVLSTKDHKSTVFCFRFSP